MFDRFSGADGTERLVEALRSQVIVNGDLEIARAIADAGDLRGYSPHDEILSQGGSDSDVYFLVTGRVSVLINGVEVAMRDAGNTIGEMAALNSSGARSARVKAIDNVVTLVVSDTKLFSIADRFPTMYRRLATEMARRLSERSKFIRVPNDRPHIFIGSSAEMLEVARAIQTGLSYDPFVIHVWTDDIFKASSNAIDDLLARAQFSDFGILVAGPDDVVDSRGTTKAAPRDNVIFELGLFAGAVGKARTLLVKARGSDVKLPTDLSGQKPLEYEDGPSATIAARMASLCTDIRKHVNDLGVK